MCVASWFMRLYLKRPNIMTSEEYMTLYEKFIAGTITPDEQKALFDYRDGFKLVDSQLIINDEEYIKNRVFNKIILKTSSRSEKIASLRTWWFAAAVILISITSGIIFNKHFKQNKTNEVVSSQKIKPVSNAPVLTLSNGSKISLHQVRNGVLFTDRKILIRKLKNSQLEYEQINASDVSALGRNTLSIPRGGQYQVTLVDGTKVWLNAETSLSYSTNFSGKERIVELKGEAYFEVAKNEKKPFIVKANGVDVKVLGTHFNVNAYERDPVKTTLFEGSVRLTSKNSNVILKPGQQAIASEDVSGIVVNEVKLSQAAAWKSGYFAFQDDNIIEIMKQIRRWYDIDVEYRGDVTNKTFGGIYSKDKDLPELLNGLELTGLLHFKIEGRRVIVLP